MIPVTDPASVNMGDEDIVKLFFNRDEEALAM